MLQLIEPANRPGLLVSVRDAREALAALAGDAHVIDVKEPDRGSLGAANVETIDAVVRAVDGRAPVTAAAGELIELIESAPRLMPDGVSQFKIGLAGCRAMLDWKSHWIKTMTAICPHRHAAAHAVAVAYADWLSAQAPEPHEVLRAALAIGCPALLVDTWDKSGGALFDHWHPTELASFIECVHSHGLILVLAGSLTRESIARAAKLAPDLLAVRTAACDSGRGGTVSQSRVAALRRKILDAHSVPI
jgi:uncharacterized protein (UPF0264 family)